MNKFFVQTLLLCLFSFVGITTFAYDCEVDGIYYKLDKTKQTASVTFGSTSWGSAQYNVYKGDIVIPSTIEYGNVIYSVTGITPSAFEDCRDLTSITIPKSIVTIGQNAFSWCI